MQFQMHCVAMPLRRLYEQLEQVALQLHLDKHCGLIDMSQSATVVFVRLVLGRCDA